MNLESIIDLALAIGRVVLALVFIGCILTLLLTQ
jgi:cbb3-type cytochrome oxidase subunit 3